MAAPTITQTYPADTDTGIPVGVSIEILFDKGIDLETAKSSVVLYGADFDQTSGPDQVLWTDGNTLQNPFYLRSPGFQGLVPMVHRIVYWDLLNDVEIDPGAITGEALELSSNIGHKLIVTPRQQLAADTPYSLFIMGDPDSAGSGISSRTVFDVEAGGSNVGTDGVVGVYGGYDRSVADTIIVEITTAGDIGEAKYRWYYSSGGVGTAIAGRITSRRYRRLEDGLQINFSGSGFVLGDTYEINVEPIERMAANMQLSFTTNDGSFSTPPESPSTPATSLPPSSVLPSSVSTIGDSYLEVIDVTPGDRAFNVAVNTNEIVVTFSEDIDPATVTDSSVVLKTLSASGQYSDTAPPLELAKSLTVSGNILTINF